MQTDKIMKKSIIKYSTFLAAFALLSACADNYSNENPDDANFPYQLIIDGDEGGDLADVEDYGLAITFADYIGELPNQPITLSYEIKDASLPISIDKVVYEYEDDDCIFERELEFTINENAGTITIAVDPDLGTVPEEFEVVFLLPAEEVEFVFEITNLETTSNTILGAPNAFEYASLDGDLAGSWVLEIASEEEFAKFKEIFAPISSDLEETNFGDITGEVKLEFEFSEVNIEIVLAEEEEVTECQDGETETSTENKIIEIEADYEAEEGELKIEGSHFVIDDETLEELDFILESEYQVNEDGSVGISILKLIDQDNYEEGEELFLGESSFTLIKD